MLNWMIRSIFTRNHGACMERLVNVEWAKEWSGVTGTVSKQVICWLCLYPNRSQVWVYLCMLIILRTRQIFQWSKRHKTHPTGVSLGSYHVKIMEYQKGMQSEFEWIEEEQYKITMRTTLTSHEDDIMRHEPLESLAYSGYCCVNELFKREKIL